MSLGFRALTYLCNTTAEWGGHTSSLHTVYHVHLATNGLRPPPNWRCGSFMFDRISCMISGLLRNRKRYSLSLMSVRNSHDSHRSRRYKMTKLQRAYLSSGWSSIWLSMLCKYRRRDLIKAGSNFRPFHTKQHGQQWRQTTRMDSSSILPHVFGGSGGTMAPGYCPARVRWSHLSRTQTVSIFLGHHDKKQNHNLPEIRISPWNRRDFVRDRVWRVGLTWGRVDYVFSSINGDFACLQFVILFLAKPTVH